MPAASGSSSTATRVARELLGATETWYDSQRAGTGRVNTNVMCAGLIMTEHMRVGLPLSESDYLARSQVKGLSGQKIADILAAHGEERAFTREGGRTSRQTVGLARELADVLNGHEASYNLLLDSEKDTVRLDVQDFFVQRVQVDFFAQQRIGFEYEPGTSTRELVARLLRAAGARGGNTGGAVAQHLIGAALTRRFPDQEIGRDSYTTADLQTDRAGDFTVGDSAFHVTLSPTDHLASSRCRANVRDGYQPIILVPDNRVAAAKQLSENAGLNGKAQVHALEDFIGVTVDGLGNYAFATTRAALRQLLEEYNARVVDIEPDPSLLIEIPANL